MGMYEMPKDEFPQVTIRQGVVAAIYPGATSEEVEQQVARPLERYLFTFGEVNRVKTTTTSQNGLCIVMVKLNDDVNNKDEVWSKIKHGLSTFKLTLPQGVLGVIVNDDFGAAFFGLCDRILCDPDRIFAILYGKHRCLHFGTVDL